MTNITGAAAAAALGAFVFLSGPTASAEHRDSAESAPRAVATADLDLTNPEDVEALLSRLRYAAARACGGPVPDARTPKERTAYRHCRAAALQEAADQADAPTVDAAITAFVATLQPR